MATNFPMRPMRHKGTGFLVSAEENNVWMLTFVARLIQMPVPARGRKRSEPHEQRDHNHHYLLLSQPPQRQCVAKMLNKWIDLQLCWGEDPETG